MMKSIIRKSLVVGAALLLLAPLSSCGDSQDKPISELSTSGPVSIEYSTNATTKSRVVAKAGESFFIKVSSPSAWTLSLSDPAASAWLEIEELRGDKASSYGIAIRVKANTGEQRSVELILNALGQSDRLTLTQQGAITRPDNSGNGSGTGTNTNTLPTGEHIDGNPLLWEVPALAGGNHMYFVTHSTADGEVNYSLEYDTQRYHPRFVAFSFDAKSAASKVNRSDSWAWDPKIPQRFATGGLDQGHWFSGTGYSRGHMVASSDRLQSLEANKQTFYYTNMSPQKQDHNGGIWLQLEALGQSWGRNRNFCDVLYVAKGGTIADGQIEDRRIRDKMVIPKYYWMAMVMKKGSEYHGIAFWTEHRKYSNTNKASLSLSIDELETKLGFDLFPNIPDDIETRVEQETSQSHRWPGL